MCPFRGIVHPKMKISWKCAHPQVIQDVDEFVSSSDLEKCSIASVSQQWMLCSEWVPSEWESKQLIKTSQYSTSNPHHSSPSVNVFRRQKLKQIHHYDGFYFTPLLLAKVRVHNSDLSYSTCILFALLLVLIASIVLICKSLWIKASAKWLNV